MKEQSGDGRRRWGRVAAIVVAIIVAVYVLFTWVFPWITEMGLSPALEQ